MSSRPTINTVIIDALDPPRLARFWSEVLGRPIAAQTGPYVWLQRESGLSIGFQRTTLVKAGKNRVHLDIEADDPQGERLRIEKLGGHYLPDYREGGFLVMADIEGNEFCILPRDTVDIDDDGRADYLSTAVQT